MTQGTVDSITGEGLLPGLQTATFSVSIHIMVERVGVVAFSSSYAKSLQLCPTLCDPINGSPPGSPSPGFSRQEHWSGLPFPSPVHENESEVAQSCLTPSNPMDCSLPGSSAHGIFQARVLEWVAIMNGIKT